MSFTKEEENFIKCSESIDKIKEDKRNDCQIEDNESKRKKELIKYHNWFLIHSGMKKDIKSKIEESLLSMNSQIDDTSSKTKEKEEEKEIGENLYEKYFYRICDYKPLETKKDYYDYEAWFKKHSGLLEKELKKEEKEKENEGISNSEVKKEKEGNFFCLHFDL